MFLITSAAYLNPEFTSEFGQIPPAFLPVGNKRLYRLQAATLKDEERVVLTLPEHFPIPDRDLDHLDRLGMEVLKIPEGLSLGQSIVTALEKLDYQKGPLSILHGDTLIYDLPSAPRDVITQSRVVDNYDWAVFKHEPKAFIGPMDPQDTGGKMIVNGFFNFSQTDIFIQSIRGGDFDFIQGINRYADQCPLTPVACHQWFDFGHIHTYYRSRAHVRTTRVFNQMTISPRRVEKKSAQKKKIKAEAQWFETLPPNMRVHVPNYLGQIPAPHGLKDKKNWGYGLEYLYLTPLNELYVFGNTPPLVWGQIFKACAHFLEECQNHPGPEQSADQISTLFQEKTRQRLESQALASGLDLTAPWVFNGKNLPSIDQICQNIAPLLPGTQKTCLVHGDFCLSNIFYDFRTRAIKVIDPRGLSFDGSPTLHGDPCYDIAKLAHSVTGKYDFILAGFFKLTRDGAHQINFELPSTPPEVAGLFDTLIVQGQNLNSQTLLSLQIHLFLSMLPLHNDDETRQQALLANALRLYLELETTR